MVGISVWRRGCGYPGGPCRRLSDGFPTAAFPRSRKGPPLAAEAPSFSSRSARRRYSTFPRSRGTPRRQPRRGLSEGDRRSKWRKSASGGVCKRVGRAKRRQRAIAGGNCENRGLAASAKGWGVRNDVRGRSAFGTVENRRLAAWLRLPRRPLPSPARRLPHGGAPWGGVL
jgi:hypothetical protein